MKLEKDLRLLDAHIGVFNWRNVRRLDWPLVALVSVLALIGFIMLLSASDVVTWPPYYVRQIIFFLVGIAVALGIVCTDYRFLVALAPVAYIVSIALLVAVLFVGEEVNGARRWISVGPFNLQPSEFAKVTLVYILAWYLPRVHKKLGNPLYLALGFGFALVPIVLIKFQPSLSSGMMLLPIAAIMLFVGGCSRNHLIALFIVGALALPLGYSQLSDYQKARIGSFMNPESQAQGSGYQQIQTRITVGSGQLDGRGFRGGVLTHFKFLPEYHTDFIFALLAEEQGFIGAVGVLGLIILLLLRGIMLARDCQDFSGALLAVGSVSVLFLHVIVNTAVNTAIMPVTGQPFPFLSYGGSFYIATMMYVGTILSVNVRRGYFD